VSEDDRQFGADLKSHRAYRLAPYLDPIPPAIKRGLALEDAIAAAQRAAMAALDASVGEPDKRRVAELRAVYVALRISVADLERLK